jgi:leader peptidase (prepilin peptidase) / N-methyltransferase
MSITVIIPLILGWIAGLFINYISDVLPVTRRVSQPGCTACGSPCSWTNYLLLRACRSCGKRRSLRTWLVQILAVAAFVYFWIVPSTRLGPVLTMLVLIYFGILMVIDLEHRLILHVTSLVGAILGLVVGTYIYSKEYTLLVSVGQSLLGGVVGFGIMFLLYKFGELVARYRARKLQAVGQADDEEEALGGGDVYLAGVLGLMMGWPVVLALIYGALLGGIVSLILIVVLLIRRRYSSNVLMTFIPYGPFILLGAFYVLFFL